MIHWIKTVPRKQIETFKDVFLKENNLIISIIDPDMKPVFSEDTERVITVFFSDITPGPFLRHGFFFERGEKFCTSEDAKKIFDFILKHSNSDKEEKLVCQCSAGICRSGAVATFAQTHSNMSDVDFVRENEHIKPNEWVLWKLIEQQWKERI